MNPYVYIATGQSRDVRRQAPTGARLAVHYPDLGRTIELQTDAHGRWTLADIPAPGCSGASVPLASGRIIAFSEPG